MSNKAHRNEQGDAEKVIMCLVFRPRFAVQF